MVQPEPGQAAGGQDARDGNESAAEGGMDAVYKKVLHAVKNMNSTPSGKQLPDPAGEQRTSRANSGKKRGETTSALSNKTSTNYTFDNGIHVDPR